MKSSLNISQKIAYFFSKFTTREVSEYINPTRDWMYGLVLATFVLCAGFAYFAFQFYSQFGISETKRANEKTVVTYNEKELHTFTEKYAAKEVIFNELRKNIYSAPPPIPIEITSSTPAEVITPPLAGEPIAQ